MSASPPRRPLTRWAARLLVLGLAVTLVGTLRELAFARNRARHGGHAAGAGRA